ncbi:MAG TPA: amidohydrolase family protein [Tepidiformaceae bacterium]|nr:amidohydrolase family protein [Tepidiformaceae bacterium]
MTAIERDLLIIDGDSHVLEPPNLWDEYLEPEFRARAIRITRSIPARDGETRGIAPLPGRTGAQAPSEALGDLPEMAIELKARLAADEHLIIDREIVLSGGLSGLGGVGFPRGDLPYMTYLDAAPPASMETEARIKLFDDSGIHGGVVFPTIGILWDSDDPTLADAYARAYNRWCLDFVGQHPQRIYPMAHVALHDPALALAELRRCLKLGFKGVFLPPEPVLGKSPAHPDFDPLWHELEDAGIPVCLHVIVRFNRILENPTRFHTLLVEPSRTYAFGLGATFQIIPAMASLIMSGFFDRFPRLKLLCVEAGAGWAPYIAHRLDEKYEMFGYAEKTKEEPSVYMKRNVWYVVEPREPYVDMLMDSIGETQFIWGSDYPHIDSSEQALDQVLANASRLSEHRRRLLLGENARTLYGLDVGR